jgi:hypothetical protein
MDFRKTAMLIILLEIILAVFAWYSVGMNETGLQALARYSGRLSLVVFSIIFMLLPNQAPQLSRLLSTRPFHLFALTHSIYLIILISYNQLAGNAFNPILLTVGSIAYAGIVLMPVIHVQQESGALSLSRFKIYLSLYLYITWFSFFITYLTRVQSQIVQVGGQYWEDVVLLSWICMMMGMKLPVLFFRPKKRS